VGALWQRIRRLRREALGMNRRNLAFLVPYNPQPLFALVDHKPSAKRRIAAAGIPVPATYAELALHWDLRRLRDVVAPHRDFVVKPARGAGGGGVLVVVGRDGDAFVKASGARLSLAELADHCAEILAGAFSLRQHADEVLIEYRVQADEVLGALSYRGVPDVRVLVFRGVPVQAMIRLPTRASDGRANLHMGGMGVGVDLLSGVTVHGVLGGRAVTTHPDLGRSVIGVGVPRWDEVLAIAAGCYDAIPLGLLGVDVVLDARLGPLVLEMNARPGLTIQLASGRGVRRVMDDVAARALGGAFRDVARQSKRLERRKGGCDCGGGGCDCGDDSGSHGAGYCVPRLRPVVGGVRRVVRLIGGRRGCVINWRITSAASSGFVVRLDCFGTSILDFTYALRTT
jgi:alpha-L-glutamate ligase-like protein